MANAGEVLGEKALDTVLETLGLEESCPYVDGMSEKLRKELPLVIKGQPLAIRMIIEAVESWEYQKTGLGKVWPLVLALAGDTGTGKSESALRIAETLLQKRNYHSFVDSRITSTRGYLVLRGEEYSAVTETGMEGPRHVQKVLISRIASHMKSCGGNGVILIDEVQKFVNGSIELFLSAISDEMGDIETTNWLTGAPERISTRNLIVILATDIGTINVSIMISKDIALSNNISDIRSK